MESSIGNVGDLDIDSLLAQKNLSSLNDEEDRLLHLRHQLHKVKKIREDQLRKDQYIAALKERIAVLENERQVYGKQNGELQDIMSERINALERLVVEKETAEKIYIQKIEELTTITQIKQYNDHQFSAERQRFHELKLAYEKSQEEIDALKSHLSSENAMHEHFQGLFESLRQEISGKDRLYEELRLQTSQKESTLRDEANRLRLLNEEVDSKLRLSEDRIRRQELLSIKINSELESSKQDNLKMGREIEKLISILQVNENELKILKNQINIMENTQEREKSELSEEVSILKSNNDALRAELQQIRKAIADLSKILKAVDNIYSSKGEVNLSGTEIPELVKSMRRALSELEGSDLHVVVSYLCQYIHFTIDHNHALSIRNVDHGKDYSNDRIARAFKEVEERVIVMWQEVVALDNIMTSLEDVLQKANLTVGWDHNVSASNSFADLTSGLNSKNRSVIVSKLVFGLHQALKLVDKYRAQDSVILRLQSSQEELKTLQDKYQRDVAHLQRMCDEALLAMKINEIESLKSIEQLKIDSEQKRLEQETLFEGVITKEISGGLTEFAAEFERLLLSFAHIIHYQNTQEEKMKRLQQAYQLNSKFAHGYSVLVNDLKALSNLCEHPDLMSVDIKTIASDVKDNEIHRYRHLRHENYPSHLDRDKSLISGNDVRSSDQLVIKYTFDIRLRTIAIVIIAVNRLKKLHELAKRSRSKVQLDSIHSFMFNRNFTLSPSNRIRQLILFSQDWKLPSLETLQTERSPVLIGGILQRLCDYNHDVNQENSSQSVRLAVRTTKMFRGQSALPEHTRTALRSHSLLSVLTGNAKSNFIPIANPNTSSLTKRELFGQSELNFLHKFILDSHSDKQALQSKVKILQQALLKVQEDVVLCKRVVSTKSHETSPRRSAEKRYESQMHSSFAMDDVSTLKLEENDDDIFGKDISHISYDSLESRASKVKIPPIPIHNDPWLVGSLQDGLESSGMAIGDDRRSNESVASMISRYSQNIADVKRPLVHPYRYDAVVDESLPFRSKKEKILSFLDESKDRDLMDIYHDIGKLTNKLESRIRASTNSEGLLSTLERK